MARRVLPNPIFLFLAWFLAIMVIVCPAQAYTTYELTAVSRTSRWTDFSLRFVDLDSDGKLDWNEIVQDSFKGVTRFTDTSKISFLALASKPSGPYAYPENWVEVDLRDEKSPFFDDLSLFFIAEANVDHSLRDALSGNWIFSRSTVPAVIPIPSTLLLFGAGLLCLANYRRQKLASNS
jgi:hypothetical protein